MNKAKKLLEGMGINPLGKIDNNCDSYWTLYELIDHCADQFSIPDVGISLESREQKILALLLIKHINGLNESSMKAPELIEEYRTYYSKLLDKINEV